MSPAKAGHAAVLHGNCKLLVDVCVVTPCGSVPYTSEGFWKRDIMYVVSAFRRTVARSG